MSWSTQQAENRLIGRPVGRVDEKSWEALLGNLTRAIAAAAAAKLDFVLDLSRVDYMSSRGLRVLTLARREAETHKINFTLAQPNERMREILAISRYDKIFKIEDSLD
ncbi:MAG: STAS domain-containing protein [Pseudomonadota bacterium]